MEIPSDNSEQIKSLIANLHIDQNLQEQFLKIIQLYPKFYIHQKHFDCQ